MGVTSMTSAWVFILATLSLPAAVSTFQYSTRDGYIAHFLSPRQDNPDVDFNCIFPCDADTCGQICAPATKRDLSSYSKDSESALQVWNATGGYYYYESDPEAIGRAVDHVTQKRSLARREFSSLNPDDEPVQAAQINQYVKRQNVPEDGETRDPQFPDDPDGFFSGTQNTVQYMAQLGTEKLQWGTGGLHGCTMLAIISKRGVYMAHFWESYTTRLTDSLEGDLQTQWQQRVLDAMEGNKVTNPVNPPPNEGGKKFDYKAPLGPPVNWNLFNQKGDNTIAFFMTPGDGGSKNRPSKQPLYPNKIGLVADLIRSHVPGVRVSITPYQRLLYGPDENGNLVGEDVDKINKSSRGMCLLQYDGQGTVRLMWEKTIWDSAGIYRHSRIRVRMVDGAERTV